MTPDTENKASEDGKIPFIVKWKPQKGGIESSFLTYDEKEAIGHFHG